MRYLLLILFASMLFTSCSYKQDQYLFQKQGTTAAKPADSMTNIANYRIQPQDILQITNVQNNKSIVDQQAGVGTSQSSAGGPAEAESSSNTYTVDDDGTIGLPALGRIQIAGLTRVQARKHIEELYGKELKNPLLEVKITNLKVTLAGEVKNPGSLPLLKDHTTLIEVIGEAGGLTEKANEKNVQVIRTNQHSKVDQFDLSDINTLSDPRIYLQNGDIIYVLQNKKAVRNNSLQNFGLVVQPALLVINLAVLIYTFAHR